MQIQFKEKDEWVEIIKEDFTTMHNMLNDIEKLINDYPSMEQINFYRPLKYMIFEAAMEAAKTRRQDKGSSSEELIKLMD